MTRSQASLEHIPDDILAHIIDHLDDRSLARLRIVSKSLDHRISTFGIPLYLSQHPIHYTTLHPASSKWRPTNLFNHNAQINHAIKTHNLHALQIGRPWPQRSIPVLDLTHDRLLIGAGTLILSHTLTPHHNSRNASAADIHPIAPGKLSSADIVGLHSLPDGGVIAAHFDGMVQRLDLTTRRSTAHYAIQRDNLHVLAGRGDNFMTAGNGNVWLYKANSPWIPPSSMKIDERPWSALLTENAYIGLNGGIQVARLTSSGLVPESMLHGMMPGHSAAYGLAEGDGGELLSAWYDGVARVHDLRSGPDPVLELSDPWSDSALYSCAYVGSHGIAAGGAQHGIVSVWDVRYPKGGWSVFSPGGKGSPVYQLAGDGGKLWGVTERRAFVLAFDGSGEVVEGIVRVGARVASREKEVPKGFGRRGRKLAWTVHYGEHAEREVSMGYCHGGRGMNLFETRVVV